MKFKQWLFAMISMLMLFSACKKNEEVFTENNPIKNKKKYALKEMADSRRISGAISEFAGSEAVNDVTVYVVDTRNNPVKGADIEFAGQKMSTDAKGVAVFKDARFPQNMGYIKVSKDGFFDGSRTILAVDKEHESQTQARIMLVPLNRVAVISSDREEQVRFSVEQGEITIDFRAGYLNEDGSEYHGEVTVYATYLDPRDESTTQRMPGDLVGIRTDNSIVQLITYGMVNVQLVGESGQILQIQNPAIITAPIHPDQRADAPDVMPMWYFNEDDGIWVEEGEANRVGNTYVAEVSHFTSWNYDWPGTTNCFLFIKIVDPNGIAVPGASVTLSSTAYTNTSTYWGPGWEGGWVPAGISLTLTASYVQCGTTYSNSITLGPYSSRSTNYQVVSITMPSTQYYIHGQILDCSGNSVSGTVTLNLVPGGIVTVPTILRPGGGFMYAHTFSSCVAPTATITATSTGLSFTPITQTLALGTNTINLTPNCEYIEYSINGGPIVRDVLTPNGGEIVPGSDFMVEAFNSALRKTRIESHTLTPAMGIGYGSGAGDIEFTDLSDPGGISPGIHPITFDLISYPATIGGIIEVDFSGMYTNNVGATNTIRGKAYIQRRF